MDGQTAQLSCTGCKAMEVTSSLFATEYHTQTRSQKSTGNMSTLFKILQILVVEAAMLKVWQLNGGMGQGDLQIMKNDLNKRK